MDRAYPLIVHLGGRVFSLTVREYRDSKTGASVYSPYLAEILPTGWAQQAFYGSDIQESLRDALRVAAIRLLDQVEEEPVWGPFTALCDRLAFTVMIRRWTSYREDGIRQTYSPAKRFPDAFGFQLVERDTEIYDTVRDALTAVLYSIYEYAGLIPSV